MGKSFKFTFANGLSAHAIQVHSPRELPAALNEIGLNRARPTLVLAGGADGLSRSDLERLRPMFVGTLAPLAQRLGAYVLDGGTDAGVMKLMGQARAEANGDFPLIGVAAAGTVATPDANVTCTGATPLEPHHTHFVLIPGSHWGDESPWLGRTAGVLADGAPSVTVLVNGGETSGEDVSQSVSAGRPVVVVGGSVRIADDLAAALAGDSSDGRFGELIASGLLQTIAWSESSDTLTRAVEKILAPKG